MAYVALRPAVAEPVEAQGPRKLHYLADTLTSAYRNNISLHGGIQGLLKQTLLSIQRGGTLLQWESFQKYQAVLQDRGDFPGYNESSGETEKVLHTKRIFLLKMKLHAKIRQHQAPRQLQLHE